MDTVHNGLSHKGANQKEKNSKPMWIQSATNSHTREQTKKRKTVSPCGYSPQRTLTQGTSTSQTHTAHVVQSAAVSHAWDKYITDTQPMWYSLQRTLSHGTSTSQAHTAHVVQSAADSHAWDKYITDTHSTCGTVRSGLSRMGQVHHRHTQPMWYSPQRTLTHGTSTSQTHTAHVVQSAADSHAWDKYITDTRSPCGTVCSGLSRMGQVHHGHIQPMWYSLQRTLLHGTSTSQTHTAHVVQSAADSLAWDKYITDTQPMWYSLQRTLSHGTSTSQAHTAHVVQSAANSHAWDKYIIDTRSPCGTVRSRLSRM